MPYSVAKHPVINGAYGIRDDEGAWIENDAERRAHPERPRQALAFTEDRARQVADAQNSESSKR